MQVDLWWNYDQHLYLHYEESQRLLSYILSLELYGECRSRSGADIERFQRFNLDSIYRKCVTILNQKSSLDMSIYFLKCHRMKRQCVPKYFVAESNDEKESPVDFQMLLITKMRKALYSNLDPKLALLSLQDSIVRLYETFHTSCHNEIWKEQLLSSALLCTEVWKSLFLSIDSRDIFEKYIDQIIGCEQASNSLEFLVHILNNEKSMKRYKLGVNRIGNSISHNEELVSSFTEKQLTESLLKGNGIDNVSDVTLSSEPSSSFYSDDDLLLHVNVDKQIYEEVNEESSIANLERGTYYFNKNCVVSNCMDMPQWTPIISDTFEKNARDYKIRQLSEINTMLSGLKGLTEDMAHNVAHASESLDFTDTCLEEAVQETREVVVDLAKISKSRSSWWGLSASSAGLLGGSLLSVPFGPVGMIAGASIGSILGYRSAEQIKSIHHHKLNKIIAHMDKK